MNQKQYKSAELTGPYRGLDKPTPTTVRLIDHG